MFLFYTMVVLGNLYFTPTDLFGDYGGSGKLMLNYGNARVYIMVR